jgi:hypothetical protein
VTPRLLLFAAGLAALVGSGRMSVAKSYSSSDRELERAPTVLLPTVVIHCSGSGAECAGELRRRETRDGAMHAMPLYKPEMPPACAPAVEAKQRVVRRVKTSMITSTQ